MSVNVTSGGDCPGFFSLFSAQKRFSVDNNLNFFLQFCLFNLIQAAVIETMHQTGRPWKGFSLNEALGQNAGMGFGRLCATDKRRTLL